jgi:hypothetical protein
MEVDCPAPMADMAIAKNTCSMSMNEMSLRIKTHENRKQEQQRSQQKHTGSGPANRSAQEPPEWNGETSTHSSHHALVVDETGAGVKAHRINAEDDELRDGKQQAAHDVRVVRGLQAGA